MAAFRTRSSELTPPSAKNCDESSLRLWSIGTHEYIHCTRDVITNVSIAHGLEDIEQARFVHLGFDQGTVVDCGHLGVG